MKRCRYFLPVGALFALALLAGPTLAGEFANIVIDDVYTDWAGIPVLDTDPLDTPAGVDIANIQIANDNTYLYMHITYHTPTSFNTYVSFDIDNNVATGFNIFGAGLVGSEAAWVNDFDFDQRAGFNIGTLKDPVRLTEPESGSGILSSFANSIEREVAFRLDTTFDPFVGAGDVFPTDTFTLLVWTDQGDVSGAITYTLAVPEPQSLGLGLLGLAGFGFVSRRKVV